MSTINDSEVIDYKNNLYYDVCDEIDGENLLNYKIYKIKKIKFLI